MASDSEDNSDLPQVVEQGTEEDEPTPKGKKGKANRATKGRTSIESNGARPSRKGKERARSPEPVEDGPEDNFQFDDDQQDYGGGDDDGYASDGGVPFEDDQGGADQDEEEVGQTEDEVEDEPRASTKAKGKGKEKDQGKGKSKANSKGKGKADPKSNAKVAKEKAAPVASISNGRKRLVNKPTLEPIIERKRPRDDEDEDDDGGELHALRVSSPTTSAGAKLTFTFFRLQCAARTVRVSSLSSTGATSA